MYIYDGIIPQVPVITDGWALAYFCHLDLAFFPARVILEISDLGNKRAWLLDDIFLGFRSAQSPLNIQAPAEKKWSSRMRSELHGDLELVSPLMAGVYDEISVNLELSWYPGHISIAWYEANSFVRLTTRAAPSTAKWEAIDFDSDLLTKFEPCETAYHSSRDQRKSSTDAEKSTTENPANTGRPRPPLAPMRGLEVEKSDESDDSRRTENPGMATKAIANPKNPTRFRKSRRTIHRFPPKEKLP